MLQPDTFKSTTNKDRIMLSKLLNQCDRRKVDFFFNWLKEPANDEQPEQSQLLETTSDYESKSIEVGNTDILKLIYLNSDNNIGSNSDISDYIRESQFQKPDISAQAENRIISRRVSTLSNISAHTWSIHILPSD